MKINRISEKEFNMKLILFSMNFGNYSIRIENSDELEGIMSQIECEVVFLNNRKATTQDNVKRILECWGIDEKN